MAIQGDPNLVTLSGNVTRDPQIEHSASGNKSCRFGLAVDRRWKNRATGEWEKQTSFFNIACFGTLADNVAASTKKGNRVTVTGRLDGRPRTSDSTGKSFTTVEVVADDVAASMKWATVDITRNPFDDDGRKNRSTTGQGYSHETR